MFITVRCIDIYFNDSKHYIFKRDGEIIAVSKQDCLQDTINLRKLDEKYITKIGPIIPLVYRDGTYIITPDTEIEGAYGKVRKMAGVVVKETKYIYAWLIEISVLELIARVYPNPEEVGLPRSLNYGRYGDSYTITMPDYGKNIPLNISDQWCKKIALSIHSLHAIGLVHRDIKHTNIVEKNGNPILIDFGLSTWFPFTNIRNRDTSIQTMYYRAPEISVEHRGKYTMAIDDWSYGVILASRKKMLHKPITTEELRRDLTILYGQDVTKIKGDALPIIDQGEAQQFLQFNPSKRQRVGDNEITGKSICSLLPISNVMFTCGVEVNLQLLSCTNWASYFAAVEYYGEGKNVRPSCSIADILFGGVVTNNPIISYIMKIRTKLFRLNTFFILVLLYPDRIIDFVLPCFYLTIGGTKFPHRDQADWIQVYLETGEYIKNDIYDKFMKGSESYDLFEKFIVNNNCKLV